VNWLASLLGALVVAVAGLAVGAELGHEKTTVDTRTVTVVHRVAVRASTGHSGGSTSTAGGQSAGATGAAGPGATTSNPTGASGAGGGSGSAGPQQDFFADYMATQDTDQLDQQATNVTFDTNPTTLDLNGETYRHAVAFDVPADPADNTASYQVPIAGFSHFASTITGLETTASASATFKLSIYKNTADSPTATVLYHQTFTGPSGTHPMNFDTQGATDLVFVWSENSASEPDEVDQFILADPVVTSIDSAGTQ
jgi:hypothetical protein